MDSLSVIDEEKFLAIEKQDPKVQKLKGHGGGRSGGGGHKGGRHGGHHGGHHGVHRRGHHGGVHRNNHVGGVHTNRNVVVVNRSRSTGAGIAMGADAGMVVGMGVGIAMGGGEGGAMRYGSSAGYGGAVVVNAEPRRPKPPTNWVKILTCMIVTTFILTGIIALIVWSCSYY